ncbi:glucosaminidase domain-containing protein [Chondrinema litorale]|uniref:glucosaminidase domain-containing protein n=1 Tax=Chondrinema litorale TaxID=2994555 RepID=UPI002543359B|nr:glucosaminidase domain-containing protein [Chondrinema litorale]UZR92568.1 glucosaminidase domain-containing protein [Chondrinema litorale]
MKEIKVTLPIVKHHGLPVRVRLGLDHFVWETQTGIIYYTFNKWLLTATLFLFMALIYFIKSKPEQITRVYNLVQKDGIFTDEAGEVHDIDFPYSEFDQVNNITEQKPEKANLSNEELRSSFMEQKHQLIYRYKTTFEANRAEQLPVEALLKMNKEISELFISENLNQFDDEVVAFFKNTDEIYKIETALMEQAKYHIPASIKMAQAVIATNYGKQVTDNNYFSIRDNDSKENQRTVTEYLTQEQILKYKEFIISYEPTKYKKPDLFACKIKQTFKKYYSPWASFRDHSTYLTKTNRFAPLFTLGNNYKEWAKKLGSPFHGGLGYSTNPDYGNELITVIEKYNLDLLDH